MSASEIIHALNGRNGVCRCPAHDDKRPSLSIKDGDDGGIIVHCFAGCHYADIKDELRRRGLLPDWERSKVDPERQAHIKAERSKRDAETREKNRPRLKWCESIWGETLEATETPVAAYLASRGINEAPPTIRAHKALRHADTGLHFWAMVAAVTQWPSSKISGLHRTYLRPGGEGKAQVSQSKMMAGLCSGGAVRLAPAGASLAVTEGIETGLSIQQAMGIPTWAALSTSGIKSLVLPDLPIASKIIIAADNDVSGQGQYAAEVAAERWSLEGRNVRIALPLIPGTDFNDLLLEEGIFQ
jgi:putative DNA primase/helicase